MPDALRLAADNIEKRIIAEKEAIEAKKEAKEAKDKLEKNQYKIDGYDRFIGSDGVITVQSFAKGVPYGPNKMYRLLRENRILMDKKRKNNGHNLPYQKYIDAGYFKVKLQPVDMGPITKFIPKTIIFPIGVDWLYKQEFMKKIVDKIDKQGELGI